MFAIIYDKRLQPLYLWVILIVTID